MFLFFIEDFASNFLAQHKEQITENNFETFR